MRVGRISSTVPVDGQGIHRGLPVNFANQVVPIFTKLGCNAGGCHGKASGQNGFRLSLLGFEPALDYETLVKEGRGRRLFPAAPDASLLLTKATAKVPHGGGKRLDPDSHEYRLIRAMDRDRDARRQADRSQGRADRDLSRRAGA